MIRRLFPSPPDTLSAEDTVLAIIAASPRREIHGKKRVHKSAFLCQYCHAPINSRFQIQNFGVFSGEIADALDIMTAFGELRCREEQVGRNRYFSTVYTVAPKVKSKHDTAIENTMAILAQYTMPTLEVASTIAYFMNRGCSEIDAVRRTEWIKPDLSTPEQLRTSKTLLRKLDELRGHAHGQRPENP